MLRKITVGLIASLSLAWGISSAHALTWQECYTEDPASLTDAELEQCIGIMRWFQTATNNQLNTCKQDLQNAQSAQAGAESPLQVYQLSPSTTTTISPTRIYGGTGTSGTTLQGSNWGNPPGL